MLMDHDCFSSQVSELSLEEVDEVDGGVVPLLIGIAYVGIAIDAAVLVSGCAYLAGMTMGYASNRH